MRIASFAWALVGITVPLATWVVGCSSDAASSGASGASSTTGDPGHVTPQGCGYEIHMDPSRGSGRVANDDKVSADATPKRVRLGVGGATELGAAGYADPSTTTAFVWDTDVGTTATKLRLGTSEGALDMVREGFSYLLPGGVPMRVHRADACGLTPQTTYYYQVGGGPAGGEVWSDVRSFTTLEGPSATGEVLIGVSGDSRDSIDTIWPLLQGRMAKAGVAFQLFTGDSINLALDTSENDYARWFDAASQAGSLGAMQLFAIGGNHENLQAQWLANHALPGEGLTQGVFASFDAGPVHVVLVDDQLLALDVTRLDFPDGTGGTVFDWLKADLKAANARRAEVPWIIVANHRGVLSTSNHGEDSDVLALRDKVMPLYDEHHVDLVVNGHDHNYERSTPTTGPSSAPAAQDDPSKGTVYVVCAGAGAEGYGKGNDPVAYRAFNADFGDGTPYVGVYATVHVNAKTLTLRAYGLEASGGALEDDTMIDEVSWSK